MSIACTFGWARCSRRLVAALLLGTCSLTAVAVTPPAAAQEKAELDKAREKFRQAIAAEAAGNWTGALSLLREVAAVKMTPQVRYNMALCEENLGQLVAALGNYELALGDGQAANATDVTSVVPARIEGLRARIPKLVISKPDATHLTSITVDGVQLGSAMVGKEMPVDPGSHVVEATAKGFQNFTQSVEVAEKETKTVEIVLTALSQDAGTVAGPASSPGSGAEDRGADRKSNVVPYVVGGVGVVSLAASGVFLVLRSGTMSDLDKVCGANRDDCPADSQSTFDQGKTYTTLANVTLGLGVAALGTGAVLYFTSREQGTAPKTARIGVTPAAPHAQVGASVIGRF